MERQLKIIDSRLAMDEVLDLTASMDAYLSLHRTEGLGLGMLEAMSLGVPVVATGYGGNMEFMREANSFIVPFEYRTWTPSCGFPREVADWGEPNVEEAAKLLRQIRDDPVTAPKKAGNGIAFVRDFYSLENFKKDVQAFLDS